MLVGETQLVKTSHLTTSCYSLHCFIYSQKFHFRKSSNTGLSSVLLRFGPTMLDTSERALDSGWNRCAAISGRARFKVGHRMIAIQRAQLHCWVS